MANNVLFEIGVEELPARFVDDAEMQLKDKTIAWLNEARISYNSITSYSTPRRISIVIRDIAEVQSTIEEEARGPAVSIAKDEQGQWTKAAIGFAKGQGKTVEDLVEKEVKGKSYVFVTKRIEGKPTKEILPGFKEIITSLTFSSNMRWGEQSLRFARPIRWLVALYGEEVIPFEIAGVRTSNVTYGHRFLGKPTTINDAEEYERILEENYVIADAEKRKTEILNGIKALEEENNYKIIVDNDLLAEVTNLVEYPTVFQGTFEEGFLKLPSDVLIISMKEHQRYFPVKSSDGNLLPYFIGVRNGNGTALQTVVKGNEKVLRARLADAEFFYEEDQKNSIDFYLNKLERVVFQEKLGTVAEKVQRVRNLTQQIAEKLELPNEATKHAIRAAEIGKFDLMTNMVNEFTELQGIIGEIYALNFKEENEVAIALREQYMPTHANGELPATEIGAVLSVAEKIDTIVGIISVGLTPSGSQDPYALRRQAAGVLRILEDRKWKITLEELLKLAFDLYDELDLDKDQDYQDKIYDFFKLRAGFLLKELGIEQDVVQAVLNEEIGNFNYSIEKAKILSNKRQDASFKATEEALVRILNLADKAESNVVNPDLFETDSEKQLYEQYLKSKQPFEFHNDKQEGLKAFEQLELLADPIHQFFDNNMVMADNIEIRNNRLALVSVISVLIREFADLTMIEWKQSF